MHLLRYLFFIRGRFQFSVQAVHIEGTNNTWARRVIPLCPPSIPLHLISIPLGQNLERNPDNGVMAIYVLTIHVLLDTKLPLWKYKRFGLLSLITYIYQYLYWVLGYFVPIIGTSSALSPFSDWTVHW